MCSEINLSKKLTCFCVLWIKDKDLDLEKEEIKALNVVSRIGISTTRTKESQLVFTQTTY
jgi:hypothetical protein